MSGRLVRKVLREQELKSEVVGGDNDAEDSAESPVSSAPFRNPFDLLDDQEDDQNGDDEEPSRTNVQDTPSTSFSYDAPVTKRKTKKKKKKSKDKDSQNPEPDSLIDTMVTLSLKTKSSEIMGKDASVAEKNLDATCILAVDPKYLKPENELRKIFGNKVVSSFETRQSDANFRVPHGGRRASYNVRKTVLVSPPGYWPRWDGSLSMEFLESKKGINYFKYVHTSSYKHTQEIFEGAKAAHDLNTIASILARNPYHVEALIIFAEVFKFSGEHQSSADSIGKCLFALECAWHPQFNPLSGNCQLKYSHETNRPLFQALFHHMNGMHRRGCHRSALEVCKLLLSLDPDDPMGALCCIDYFALRAQEFKWLEEFSERYDSNSSIWLFPNFSFSLSVCRFYLEAETEHDKAPAMDLMKQALMLHPLVLKKLVDKVPLKDRVFSEILGNSFFKSPKGGSPSLEHLISIYVERSYVMWRLPELQGLLKEAALQVVESIKRGGEEAKDWACVRKEAFPSQKNEYSHLMVSDFSDTVPTLPPEEIRHFMVDPNDAPQMQDEIRDVDVGRVRVPRPLAGRNPVAVILESLMPWVDYGIERNGHIDDPNQDQREE